MGSLLPYDSQPLRWVHPCGVAAGEILLRDDGLVYFSFPYGLILRDEVTLWVETVFDLILNRNKEFSESLLRWFRAFTVAFPFRGASWQWTSAPVRTGGLFFSVLMPLSFGMRSPYGSSVLVGSHLITNDSCHWCLALGPSGRASSLCLRLLLAPCSYRHVSWGSSCGRKSSRVLGSLQGSSLPWYDACLTYVPHFEASSESLTNCIPRSSLVESLSDFAEGLADALLLCPARALLLFFASVSFVDPVRIVAPLAPCLR